MWVHFKSFPELWDVAAWVVCDTNHDHDDNLVSSSSNILTLVSGTHLSTNKNPNILKTPKITNY